MYKKRWQYHSFFKEIVKNKDDSMQVFTGSALAKVFDNAFQEERVQQLTARAKAPTGFFWSAF